MHNINSQKNSIIGGIAALKTITENESSKYKNKIKSVTNEYNNIISSVLEVYTQLGGYAELIGVVENVLIKNLDEIELTIKGAIKTAIKQTIACGVEPSVDEVLVESGMTFNLPSVDPQSLLMIDPNSEIGNLMYFDNDNGVHSKDFNTFLYSVISNNVNSPQSNPYSWSDEYLQPILDVSFEEYNQINGEANSLTIKVNNFYQDKKLSSFVSDYLDSIKLFDNVQVLSSIFDDILGVKIISLNKTVDQIAAGKMVGKLCEKILNSVDENDQIDDSFYAFDNEIYNQIMEDSELKRNGSFRYNGDRQVSAVVSPDIVISSLMGIKVTEGLSSKTNLLKNTIDDIVDNAIKNNSTIKEGDKTTLKVNIIHNIISKLMEVVTMFIFTPKIMLLFSMINNLYQLPNSVDIVSFLKSNINIFKLIIVKIRDIIIGELTDKIVEMLTPMIASVLKILNTEKMLIYKKQMDDIRNLVSSVL